MTDPGLRCEYHDYVNGRCTHCGKVRIRHGIAIIGDKQETVEAIGTAIVRLSKRRKEDAMTMLNALSIGRQKGRSS